MEFQLYSRDALRAGFSMLAKLVEAITGLDDLERVAQKGDVRALNAYLKTRAVHVPQRPQIFLDPSQGTAEDHAEMLRLEAERLSGDSFDLWVLEVDGKKRLPVFSSEKKMTVFSQHMAKTLKKVFTFGCIVVPIETVVRQIDVDYIDLNLFSPKSWEIEVNQLLTPGGER